MKRKLNILHITSYLEIGGLETLIVEICIKTDKTKFNTQVLCLNGYDQAYKDKLALHNVPVYLITKKYRTDTRFLWKIIFF